MGIRLLNRNFTGMTIVNILELAGLGLTFWIVGFAIGALQKAFKRYVAMGSEVNL